jgi:hypothetical protein
MLTLPTPTVELVLADGEKFESESAIVESALRELFQRFPENVEPARVLLKVVALNRLYNTNIFAVEAVADHIPRLSIDLLLKAGSPQAVDLIAQVKIAGESKTFSRSRPSIATGTIQLPIRFSTQMSMSAYGFTKNKTCLSPKLGTSKMAPLFSGAASD